MAIESKATSSLDISLSYLHDLIKFNNNEILEECLKAEGKKFIFERDDQGNILLHLAAKYNNTVAMELLLLYMQDECGFGDNPKTSLLRRDLHDHNALHIAAIFGHVEMLSFLLEKGMSLTETDKAGNTALDFAVQKGHVDAVRFLRERDADKEKKNTSKSIPLTVAKRGDHKGMVGLLVSTEQHAFQEKKLLTRKLASFCFFSFRRKAPKIMPGKVFNIQD